MMKRYREDEKEEQEAKDVIKSLADSYGDSNEDQGKMVQLIRGLAFSDADAANEFMKALDDWTTQYASTHVDESVLQTVKVREITVKR